jgi:phage terminase large subunit GpA-like protein
MGFLSPAARVVARAAAMAMLPPLPPDITRWCEENIVFDERSAMPGPFRISAFPFLREIHEVLSPEHPCRKVTVRGSAQWGKTVSIIQPTLGMWHENGPLDSLVVHPTGNSAKEWVQNKWLPMRRQAKGLLAVFGDGRGSDNVDSLMNQETLARTGSLKVASAGSPADLTGTTRRLVIMDDLSKWEMTDFGDPEELATSRASSFDEAKIVRISTPMIEGTCRISRAYQSSDRRLYHVPCPHCGTMAPLTWENFKRNIDPERLHAAHFTCDSCGAVIEHHHKRAMVAAGKWVAQNPAGDHPGFHLWRAYVPQRDWASIAVDYAQVMGWTGLAVSQSTEAALLGQVQAETEQTFYNDVLGLPFQQASKGPDWTVLRDRTENADKDVLRILPRGRLPSTGFILTAGVDCQGDRTEVQIVAHGRNYRRWVIDYIVIPHNIGEEKCRATLTALLRTTWRTETGLRIALDMLAIDGGTYTEDVWSFAKMHPWSRVIIVKGSGSQSGPVLLQQKLDRRPDGTAKRQQKRAFMLNVSQLKADFYNWLTKTDPAERGFVQFAGGLGDEYYRQVTSEVRVLKRSRGGVVTSQWDLVEPSRRNEGLDTLLYAEAAARRKSWTAMTDEQWDLLTAERGGLPLPEDMARDDSAAGQGDLFDIVAATVAATDPAKAAGKTDGQGAAEAAPKAPARVPDGSVSADTWIKHKKGDWI